MGELSFSEVRILPEGLRMTGDSSGRLTSACKKTYQAIPYAVSISVKVTSISVWEKVMLSDHCSRRRERESIQ